MVFLGEAVQPDDICTQARYYKLEGGKQQAVEELQWFEDSLRLLQDGNGNHFKSHVSQALGIAESQDPEVEESRVRRQIW